VIGVLLVGGVEPEQPCEDDPERDCEEEHPELEPPRNHVEVTAAGTKDELDEREGDYETRDVRRCEGTPDNPAASVPRAVTPAADELSRPLIDEIVEWEVLPLRPGGRADGASELVDLGQSRSTSPPTARVLGAAVGAKFR
jgi:hypothetical protein